MDAAAAQRLPRGTRPLTASRQFNEHTRLGAEPAAGADRSGLSHRALAPAPEAQLSRSGGDPAAARPGLLPRGGAELGGEARSAAHRRLAATPGGTVGRSWYVDETYLKVGRRWCNLYLPIDRDGALVDVSPSEHRGQVAAERFFRSAVEVTGRIPETVTSNKHASYPPAITDGLRGCRRAPHFQIQEQSSGARSPQGERADTADARLPAPQTPTTASPGPMTRCAAFYGRRPDVISTSRPPGDGPSMSGGSPPCATCSPSPDQYRSDGRLRVPARWCWRGS